MRILFFTNFYPPYELSGRGQSCKHVSESLMQRGYQAAALMTLHRAKNAPVGNTWLKNLVAAAELPGVAGSYGRVVVVIRQSFDHVQHALRRSQG